MNSIESLLPNNSEASAKIRAGLQRQRASAFHFGLQGKLIVSFLALISVCLGSSCYLFVKQSNEQTTELIGEQARMVAYTLSRAVEPTLAAKKKVALQDIGSALLKTQNILYVAFLDSDRHAIALANRTRISRGAMSARSAKSKCLPTTCIREVRRRLVNS